jgi:hypothetical protein
MCSICCPGAAEAFRETVAAGLAGDPAAVASARLVLRSMLGPIKLEPGADGSLWASYGIDFSAVVRAAGTGGRGEAICAVPVVVRVQVKLGK